MGGRWLKGLWSNITQSFMPMFSIDTMGGGRAEYWPYSSDLESSSMVVMRPPYGWVKLQGLKELRMWVNSYYLISKHIPQMPVVRPLTRDAIILFPQRYHLTWVISALLMLVNSGVAGRTKPNTTSMVQLQCTCILMQEPRGDIQVPMIELKTQQIQMSI